MDRKRYLELCRDNAISKGTKMVLYNDTQYVPIQLIIWFDSNGRTVNTAVLKELLANSTMNCRVEALKEYES